MLSDLGLTATHLAAMWLLTRTHVVGPTAPSSSILTPLQPSTQPSGRASEIAKKGKKASKKKRGGKAASGSSSAEQSGARSSGGGSRGDISDGEGRDAGGTEGAGEALTRVQEPAWPFKHHHHHHHQQQPAGRGRGEERGSAGQSQSPAPADPASTNTSTPELQEGDMPEQDLVTCICGCSGKYPGSRSNSTLGHGHGQQQEGATGGVLPDMDRVLPGPSASPARNDAAGVHPAAASHSGAWPQGYGSAPFSRPAEEEPCLREVIMQAAMAAAQHAAHSGAKSVLSYRPVYRPQPIAMKVRCVENKPTCLGLLSGTPSCSLLPCAPLPPSSY